MMIHGGLQAEFIETKQNGNIYKYGTPNFGEIVVYVSS